MPAYISECPYLDTSGCESPCHSPITAAQEFTRTEGAHKFIYTRLNTEVVDCCRIYHLPPTSSATTPPPASASLAPGPSNPMPAPALNVRPRLLPESSSRSRSPPGPSAPSLFDYDILPTSHRRPSQRQRQRKRKRRRQGQRERQKKR